MNSNVIQKFEQRGTTLITKADAITITDDDSRAFATEFSVGVRRAIRDIEGEFKPDIDQAHKLHKSLLARLNSLCAPFKDAKVIVDGEIKRDYLERARIQQEEERRAEVAAAAERKRQEDEQRAEAEEAIEEGDLETAEAILDSDVVVAPAIPVAQVNRTTHTISGAALVKSSIKVEIISPIAVIKQVAQGKLPLPLIKFDLGALKRYVKANGLEDTTIPGVRITKDAIVSGRLG